MHKLEFNPARVSLLLKKELFHDNKKTLLAIGAVFAFLLVLAFSHIIDNGDTSMRNYHINRYALILIFGGILYSSFAFNELNAPLERANYLILPASHLEKFASKWIQTVIIFPIVFTLLYFLFMFIVNGLASSYGKQINTLQWTTHPNGAPGIIGFYMIYVAVQSIFLLGSAHFRKYELFKTGLFAILLASSLAFVAIGTIYLVFIDQLDSIYFSFPNDLHARPSDNFLEFAETTMWNFVQFMFYAFLPIICWISGYFKLTEKEA